MYSILFSPFFIFLWGSTKNGCQPFFYCGCFFFPPRFSFYFHFFLIWTWCLWFDVHRHLFLLVLFLLCGCDFNQEMEVQKSTCCHSKYVLFHLLATTSLYLSTSMPVFQHLPRLFCFCFFCAWPPNLSWVLVQTNSFDYSLCLNIWSSSESVCVGGGYFSAPPFCSEELWYFWKKSKWLFFLGCDIRPWRPI